MFMFSSEVCLWSGSAMSIINLFILASVHILCVCFGHDYLELVISDTRGQEKYDDWIVSFQILKY